MSYMYINTTTSNSLNCIAGIDYASSDWLIDWYYRQVGSGSWNYAGPTFANNSNTIYYKTISGLLSGTTYEVRAVFFVVTTKVNEVVVNGTTNSAPPPVPSPLTGLVAYNIQKDNISINWNTSSGASWYDVYKDGIYQNSTSNAFWTYSGLSEYTNYTLTVYPVNGSGYGSGQAISVRTLDATAPYMTATYTPHTNSIDLFWNIVDPSPGSGFSVGYLYMSGPNNSTFNQKLNTFAGNSSLTLTTDGNGNTLSPRTTYQFYWIVYDVAGNGRNYGDVGYGGPTFVTTTGPTRPTDFFWNTNKTTGAAMPSYSGKPAPVSASEWATLQSKINDFRAYKLKGTYGFTTPIQGNNFQAFYFNQCVAAIAEMSPPTSPPNAQSIGTTIRGDSGANGFDRLRLSLNSIV